MLLQARAVNSVQRILYAFVFLDACLCEVCRCVCKTDNVLTILTGIPHVVSRRASMVHGLWNRATTDVPLHR